MSEIWLYCEGKTDPPVIRAAFFALGISNITSEATGTSPAKVASWKRQQGFDAASVSDRDYRPQSECDSTYQQGRKKFYWRRHSIENYLLEPAVIARSFELLKDSMADVKDPPAWLNSLPTSLESVTNDIQAAAKQISNQECGYISLHRIWSHLGDQLGHIQWPPPTILKDATGQTAKTCCEALAASAQELKTTASAWANTDFLAEEKVRSRYNAKLSEVVDPKYVDANKFLFEFHGKRLKRSFLKLLEEQYEVSLSSQRLQEELEKGFESLLLESPSADVANDFRELADILQNPASA